MAKLYAFELPAENEETGETKTQQIIYIEAGKEEIAVISCPGHGNSYRFMHSSYFPQLRQDIAQRNIAGRDISEKLVQPLIQDAKQQNPQNLELHLRKIFTSTKSQNSS